MKKEKQDNRYKALNEAVSIPSAQNDTLCEPGKDVGAVARALIDQVEHIKAHDMIMHIFAKTMLLGGLRVSEMLNVGAGDIDALGRLIVRSLKGGQPRVVDTGMNADQFIVWRNQNYVPWLGWNRYFVDRQFRKYGIMLKVEGGDRMSVTHALRHASAQISFSASQDLETTKSLLGQKSKTNTEIYVKQKSAKLLDRERKTDSSSTAKANNKRSKE